MEKSDFRANARRSWEKFLNVDSLRFSLTVGSVYLTAYEFLLQSLVERLTDFYAVAWTRDGVEVGPDYRIEVLSRHSMPYFASPDWFQERGALSDQDIEALKNVREHRNFVAHNIPRIVMDAGVDVNPALLGEIVGLVSKLDRWWFRNVEMPTNAAFDGKEVSEKDLDEMMSMRMYNLQLLISFVSGDEQPLRDMHATFGKVWPLESD